ncbi:hypothetical protein [Corallococcus praedator]|uniref:hypothetical protein n=1 Tax=Corallococcus praedator TaxID=2316724 RepID=UPI001FCA1648|nr:hypothetical protein [Corallococcus praedator]
MANPTPTPATTSAASPGVMRLLFVALGVGAVTVVPSLVLLFRVFRPQPPGTTAT